MYSPKKEEAAFAIAAFVVLVAGYSILLAMDSTNTDSVITGAVPAEETEEPAMMHQAGCSLPVSPIAWYPGEGHARDVIGRNDGLPLNTLYTEGRNGQAFSFDGSVSSKIDVIDQGDSPLDLSGPITVAAWVYTNDSSGRIVMKGGNYDLRIGIERLIFDSRARGCTVTASPGYGWTFPYNTWVHVAGTTNAERTVKKVYLNGELLATETYDGDEGCGSPELNNLSFHIGWNFQGLIDEVMVFDTELSEQQIRAVMNGQCIPEVDAPASCISQPEGLIGWWAGDGSGEDLIGENDAELIREMGFGEGLVGEAFHNPGGDLGSGTNPMRAEIPYSSSLDTDHFTVMAWIKPDDHNGIIISRSNEYQLELLGQARFRVLTPGFYDVASPPYEYRALLDEWTHVAGVYDGTSKLLYINGALAGTTPGRERRYDDNPVMRIGRLLPGSIDEVMLYNHALSREEIREIALAGSQGVCKEQGAREQAEEAQPSSEEIQESEELEGEEVMPEQQEAQEDDEVVQEQPAEREAEEGVETAPLNPITTVAIAAENPSSTPIVVQPVIKEEKIILENEQRIKEVLERTIAPKVQAGELPALIEEKLEAVKRIEKEDVKPIYVRKVFRPFDLKTGITFSGQHTSARLLVPRILTTEDLTLAPGERKDVQVDIQKPISTGKQTVQVLLLSEGTEIVSKDVELNKSGKGTAVDINKEEHVLDIYLSIPQEDIPLKPKDMQYFLEITLQKGKKRVYYELLGPYTLPPAKSVLFSQEFAYDPQLYQGQHTFMAKLYRGRKLVADHTFAVDFGNI